MKDVLRSVVLLKKQKSSVLNLDFMASLVGETDAFFDERMVREFILLVKLGGQSSPWRGRWERLQEGCFPGLDGG